MRRRVRLAEYIGIDLLENLSDVMTGDEFLELYKVVMRSINGKSLGRVRKSVYFAYRSIYWEIIGREADALEFIKTNSDGLELIEPDGEAND